MMLEAFAVDALRVALVLAVTLALVAALRRAPAAARRIVLATALAGALVMPVASSLAPSWRLPHAPAGGALNARELTERFLGEGSVPAVRPNVAVAERSVVPTASPSLAHIPWGAVAMSVWALGASLVLARLLLGLRRSRVLVRSAEPAPAWHVAIERAARVTGIRADVRMTDLVQAPAVTGLLWPVVLVPLASESWGNERRRAVLLHELAHVRQRDCLVQVVAQLACALHWFDPLVWVAARRLRLERELSADEAVLAAGARASRYAEDLLAIASSSWSAGDAPVGALGMGERSHLAARIAAIVGPRGPRPALTRRQSASLVGGCGLVVAAAACTAPATQAPAVPTTAATPRAAALSPSDSSAVRPELQKIADEELDRVMSQFQAEEGTIVVLDPPTGEILANAGRSHGAPADVATGRAFVTGSTLKAVTLAAALDEGVVRPDDRFDCENGSTKVQGQELHDAHTGLGTLTVGELVAVSSNVGFAKIFDRLGGARLGRWLHAFRFGVAPFDGAVGGWVPARIDDHTYAGAVAAIGEAVTASPLQVAAAYAALANDGEYVVPTLAHRAEPARRERIMKPETARTVVGLLEGVVSSEMGTGKLARIDGVRVAGKTGTASWDLPGGGEATYASFVGLVPANAPRFVILVGVAQPKGDAYGGNVAAPAFAKVASRALAAR
jgi:beta-lactamase regulating signal transducer with metallopeptidase domain